MTPTIQLVFFKGGADLGYSQSKLSELVIGIDHYYAHTSDELTKKDETLEEHTDLVMDHFEQMGRNVKFEEKMRKLILDSCYAAYKRYSEGEFDYMVDYVWVMLRDTVYLHDIGKINPLFQKMKMNNELFKNFKNGAYLDTDHSLFSAMLFIDVHIHTISEMIIKDKHRNLFHQFMYMFAYLITKHHSDLVHMNDGGMKLKMRELHRSFSKRPDMLDGYVFKERLLSNDWIEKLDDVSNFRHNKSGDSKLNWLLMRLVMSILKMADNTATAEYSENGRYVYDRLSDNDIAELVNLYDNSDVVKSIRRYESGEVSADTMKPINVLRSDMFLESEHSLLDNLDKGIFYLEAPTGSGKTNMSINLGTKLLSGGIGLSKMVYVFPFNTLIDQTSDVLNRVFPDRFSVVNSITPLRSDLDKSEMTNWSYNEITSRDTALDYSTFMTSHVRIFDTLFSNKRMKMTGMVGLCDSVIIIDEVQAYRNLLWKDIIKQLSMFSKYLNIRFVIMSATLPNLSKMFDVGDKYCSLVKDRERYFGNTIFKDRVKVDFSLMENHLPVDRDREEALYEMVDRFISIYEKHGKKKYLIEFITKASATKFYKMLGERLPDVTILEITGWDSRKNRKTIIDMIKRSDHLIVVSTQVIEAGVDIDMDVGLKDISILDSEEQFLGRINRECSKEGIAYFFDMDDARGIYRDDARVSLSLRNEKTRGYLLNKEFEEYFKDVAKIVGKNLQNEGSKKGGIDVSARMDEYAFDKVSDAMKLINNKSSQIFVNMDIEIDGKIVSGKTIWNRFKRTSFAYQGEFKRRKYELSQLRELMSHFMFSVKLKSDKTLYDIDETFSGIHYVGRGEEYMNRDGAMEKFDVARFLDTEGSVFYG